MSSLSKEWFPFTLQSLYFALESSAQCESEPGPSLPRCSFSEHSLHVQVHRHPHQGGIRANRDAHADTDMWKSQ